jgi:hypothetical protein
MAQPRHRPVRRFADARRLIIPCDHDTCMHCHQKLVPRNTWYVKKYVQTLDGPLFVAGKSNRCVNPACPHSGATYYASGVLSISLPYSTYGLDVLAFIGRHHEHDHRQLAEIQRALQQRGLLINERSVGRLYRQFLALLGGAVSQHQLSSCSRAQLPPQKRVLRYPALHALLVCRRHQLLPRRCYDTYPSGHLIANSYWQELEPKHESGSSTRSATGRTHSAHPAPTL